MSTHSSTNSVAAPPYRHATCEQKLWFIFLETRLKRHILNVVSWDDFAVFVNDMQGSYDAFVAQQFADQMINMFLTHQFKGRFHDVTFPEFQTFVQLVLQHALFVPASITTTTDAASAHYHEMPLRAPVPAHVSRVEPAVMDMDAAYEPSMHGVVDETYYDETSVDTDSSSDDDEFIPSNYTKAPASSVRRLISNIKKPRRRRNTMPRARKPSRDEFGTFPLAARTYKSSAPSSNDAMSSDPHQTTADDLDPLGDTDYEYFNTSLTTPSTYVETVRRMFQLQTPLDTKIHWSWHLTDCALYINILYHSYHIAMDTLTHILGVVADMSRDFKPPSNDMMKRYDGAMAMVPRPLVGLDVFYMLIGNHIVTRTHKDNDNVEPSFMDFLMSDKPVSRRVTIISKRDMAIASAYWCAFKKSSIIDQCRRVASAWNRRHAYQWHDHFKHTTTHQFTTKSRVIAFNAALFEKSWLDSKSHCYRAIAAFFTMPIRFDMYVQAQFES